MYSQLNENELSALFYRLHECLYETYFSKTTIKQIVHPAELTFSIVPRTPTCGCTEKYLLISRFSKY